jgi:MFS family permease
MPSDSAPLGTKILRVMGLGDLAGAGWRPLFSFWCMVLMTFFLFGDQNLASSNLSRIGEDFGFTKKEDYLWYIGGLVSLCFFLIGGIASIKLGMLADYVDRKKLLFFVVILGEVPCLLTGFAPNYASFLALRTLTGIGLGGIFPIIFSLIGDYFRPENRPSAAGWLGLAIGLGIAVGQLLGGALAHETVLGMHGWRATFVIMAAPAFPLAVLYYFFAQVPKRGAAEVVAGAAEEKHTVTLRDLRVVLTSSKTNILSLLQGIPGTIPWGLLFVYMVDYFENTKQCDVQQGNLLVVAFGATAIVGSFIGGMVGRALYRKNRRLVPLYCAITNFIGVAPVLAMVNFSECVDRKVSPLLLGLALVGGLINTQTVSNVRAILINTNLPENRGSVFAVFNLFDDLGKGLGPFFVGILVSLMPQAVAYNVAVSFWILCGIIWLFLMRTVVADEDRVTETLRARAGAAPAAVDAA